MKKKALSFLVIGAVFLTPATWAQCGQKGEYQHVIDSQAAPVSVARPDGTLAEFIGWTAAGQEQNGPPLPPPVVNYLLPGKGSISGLVWHDLNGNNQPDTGESGVPNTRVYLDNDNTSTHSSGDPSQLTDTDGLYAFPRVRRGTKNIYIDTSSLPAGFELTTSHPLTVELFPYQEVDNANFGVQDLSGEIAGTVWDQTDNVPVFGVTVFLDLDTDEALTPGEPSTGTDSSGSYLFSHIPGGNYLVQVVNDSLADEYHHTPVDGTNPESVALTPGGSLTVNFTYLHKATISGILRDEEGNVWEEIRLFLDLNGNGVYDPGEPIVITDSQGYYLFDNLLPGAYLVLLLPDQLPPGYDILTTPEWITLDEGELYTENFLTQAQPVGINGVVFEDNNDNDSQDPGENGIAGITVFLDTNSNGLPDELEPANVTNGTGEFSFTGLEHGDFLIRTDDTVLLTTHNKTTPSCVFKKIEPGQTFTTLFGYQGKLIPMHSLQEPFRVSWGGDGNLYAADKEVNSIFIHDGDLNFVGELKGLDQPLGVTADAAGNIYVGNQGRKNVEVYSPTGNLLKSIGDGSIGRPNDLALDRDNNVYVLDGDNDSVLVFNQEGTLMSAIGSSLWIRYGAAIDINYRDDGLGNEIAELYVADQEACAIHVFALDGTYKKSLGECGTKLTSNWDGLFLGLMAVAIDSSGNVHGLDNSLNVVQVFSPQTGAFLGSYNAYPPENEYILNLQTDIAIHPADNRVVVSNVATRNLEIIPPAP